MRRIAFLLSAIVMAGCPGPEPLPPVADGIFGPLGEVLPAATMEQRATFDRGREVALRRFTFADGLGPKWNVSFCGGCHERPTPGGSSPRYRNFLLVARNQPRFPQAPLGMSGVQDQFDYELSREPSPVETNVTALRNAIPFFGAGLVAEITAESILSHEDPNDDDDDGISGRTNLDQGFVGRFGRKAQNASIEQFIRGPLNNHLGITSNPLSNERRNALPVPSMNPDDGATRMGLVDDTARAVFAQAGAPDMPLTDEDAVADPELSEDDLFDLVSFAMLLAAPQPDAPTAETDQGRALFAQMRCLACHVEGLVSPRGLIPLYSDLLLHDMGEELADGIVQGFATGSEFRTQPLWGIAAVGPYLHDGRADTLDEAIRAHGGEAQAARDAYSSASDTERASIIAFLESLGGLSQRSDGLLPPEAPLPADGEYGAPMPGTDLARFEEGRRVFDADIRLSGGLGPNFNGDSCRACHFEPVIGGAGPQGLNVTRQAIVMSGVREPSAPSGGTMAHRQNVGAMRPPIDAESNFFELRQPPLVLGLGLVEQITAETIMANADPDDADADGISGRAHVLPDGRIGRLGWRADVPDLGEFTRDALFNELGVTVPEMPGHTFGGATDDDDVSDPEITVASADALTFFMAHLAAPPRTRVDPTLEDQGEVIFETIGCAACHRTLALDDGTPVPLYSDLLLHDVMAAGAKGIGSGDAGGREFRTAPLWGIATSGPYMHDGRASTVEDAIAQHFTEGESAATAFAELGAAEREAVLAFLESL